MLIEAYNDVNPLKKYEDNGSDNAYLVESGLNQWELYEPYDAELELSTIKLTTIVPSFAWLALLTQYGFKSTVPLAPAVNQRIGELATVFSNKTTSKSFMEKVDTGDDSEFSRPIAIHPYAINRKGENIPNVGLRSLFSGCADVAIPEGRKFKSQQCEVICNSSFRRACPVQQENINRTLALLNGLHRMSRDDTRVEVQPKVWEFILKRRQINSIGAIRKLIIDMELPPALIKTDINPDHFNPDIGKCKIRNTFFCYFVSMSHRFRYILDFILSEFTFNSATFECSFWMLRRNFNSNVGRKSPDVCLLFTSLWIYGRGRQLSFPLRNNNKTSSSRQVTFTTESNVRS